MIRQAESGVSTTGGGDAVPPTPYFGELGTHRRALAAAVAGMAAGFLLNSYVGNLFAPHLIAEFGWSRADFALVGTLGLVSLLVVPFVGRATDLFGVRRVAAIGVTAFPLTFVAYSQLEGSLAIYAGITFVQNLLAGATTSSTVYSRLIAERFVTARGLALAIAATAPGVVAIFATPLLQITIAAYGWRTGYLVVAAYVALVGGLALFLVPARKTASARSDTRVRRRAREDYPRVLRSSPFWIIAGGMLLCNLIYPLQSTQMNLMVMEKGASAATAAWMLSLFAAGVVSGRFACGLALDRLPTHLVAAIAMALPALGLFAVAAGLTSPAMLALSVMLMGISLGAESDLAAYLVIRYFQIDIYGTVLGLVVTAMAIAATLGAGLLSITLSLTGSFDLFLLLGGLANFGGSGLFLLLGRGGFRTTESNVPAQGA